VSLSERLQAELKDAMRDGDELRRDTLRMAISAAYNVEKEARRPLTEDEFVGVLAREVKMRRESVDAYEKAGRVDLAAKERSEVGILTGFLPQQLDEDEILELVRQAIAEVGATSARDIGRVIGVLGPRTRGRAEGRVVSGIVARELARADLAAHSHGGDAS
jgi:uncharacterized protein